MSSPTNLPKSVLVTGANRGIGLGLVKKFLEYKEVEYVFATTRNLEAAKDLRLIRDPRLHIIKMDVQKDASIYEAFKEIERLLGKNGLNLLVNNAGIYHHCFLNQYEPEKVEQMFDVNAIGPMILVQIFLPLLKKALNKQRPPSVSNAAVINITSLAGSHSFNTYGSTLHGDGGLLLEGLLPYSMSKSAANMMTRCLAGDLIHEGILVCCFCPGIVKTDMAGDKAYITVEESSTSLISNFIKLGPQHSGAYLSHMGFPYGF